MNAPLISSKERQLIQYLLNRRMHEVEKYLSRYIVLSVSNYETGSWLHKCPLCTVPQSFCDGACTILCSCPYSCQCSGEWCG
jgi:hypothetical protein